MFASAAGGPLPGRPPASTRETECKSIPSQPKGLPMRNRIVATTAVLGALAVGVHLSSATSPGRNGRLVYQASVGRHVQLFSVRPDGTRARQLTHLADSDAISPAWSPDGKRIAFARDYLAGTPNEHLDIVTIDADGSRLHAMGLTGLNGSPVWSPDGSRVLWAHPGGFELAGPDGSGSLSIAMAGDVQSPTFSPDGKRIAFFRPERGGAGLYVVRIDGTGLRRVKAFPKGLAGKVDWSPDGARIAYSTPDFDRSGLSANVYTIRADGTGLVQLTHDNGGATQNGLDSWSPDGKQFAFVSNRSGSFQVYIMSADGSHVSQITHGAEAHLAAWGVHP
jgi:TolB protein